jgi:threonine dehydratase
MSGRPPDGDVSLQHVYDAARRISGAVRRTPLQRSEALSSELGLDVLLKLECWQRTGSFKVRGAFNAVGSLTDAERQRGLVTASAGNHGQAVALAAREHGARATVFVPAGAPATKRQRIERFGATLRTEAADYDEAEALATQHAHETGACFVHAFSSREVVAGQGTVGLELLAETTRIEEVLVPVGGGGLIAGLGLVLKSVLPNVRVIGVQSTETRAMYEALAAGRAVDVEIPPTIADGLAGCTDQDTYERVARVIDDLVLVTEDEIRTAIRALYEHDGVVAEGGGAVAAAALLAGRVRARGTTIVMVTGGNIDAARLAQILGSG